uniref:Uncharacterized protein LOC100185158 n=1 Tax=Phallusia mammillata TaxID=59560 RepID=A0A6F9DIV2_9ASCI|nr:uncharacterized protein LOC100185158 [Phallusia mammillata]
MSLTIEVYDSGPEEETCSEKKVTPSANIVEYFVSKEEAERAINEFELSTSTKFIKLFRHKYDPTRSRIRWDPNTRIPFTIDQSAKLECQHGRDRDYERKEKRKSLKNGVLTHGGKRKYLRVEGSIKKNCRACISVLEIWTYPEYEIDELIKSKQTEGSKKLRELLNGNQSNLLKEYGCWVTFPSSNAHSGHVVGEAVEVTQPVDPRLITKINSLVDEGVFSAQEIKERLSSYVNNELFRDTKPPPLSNKRFHPTLKVIRNHYFRAFIDKKLDGNETPLNMKVLMTLDPLVVEKIANQKIAMSAKAIRPDPRNQISGIINRIRNNIQGVTSEADLVKARDELTSILQDIHHASDYSEDIDLVGSSLFEVSKSDPNLPVEATEEVTVLEPFYQVALDNSSFPATYAVEENVSGIGTTELQINLQPQFTPSIKQVTQNSLEQLLLKNGPHYLSLVQLKCLEPELDLEERQLVLLSDKNFKEGWLVDDVLNSYLWSLCQEYKHVLYASSEHSSLLQQDMAVPELWQDETINGKKYIFVPWNPTGAHWILLAVDVVKRTLMYLDPMQLSLDINDVLVKMAKDFMTKLMKDKFDIKIVALETKNRTLQEDVLGCGVLVCMYARWLASNQPLLNSGSDYAYRKEIFDCISGSLF